MKTVRMIVPLALLLLSYAVDVMVEGSRGSVHPGSMVIVVLTLMVIVVALTSIMVASKRGVTEL